MISITATGGVKGSANIDHHPDECPICHRTMSATGIYFVQISDHWIEGVYQCPKLECHKLCIASFKKDLGTGYYYFVRTEPYIPVAKELPPKLSEISPEFVETYQQAWEAKELGFDKIAGTGFRRSLEFLVKDYATRNASDEEKKDIRRQPMAQCIKEYISEDGIKTVAERATWLGNDETHYLRKWEDKDINDLIDLIDSVSDWIIIHLKTEHLKKSMIATKAST